MELWFDLRNLWVSVDILADFDLAKAKMSCEIGFGGGCMAMICKKISDNLNQPCDLILTAQDNLNHTRPAQINPRLRR